jgi:D-inositol-3-phosphate glycosyltransferase
LLFVGRIEPLKGIDVLIEAIAILRQQGLPVCLSVIGGEAEGDPETTNGEMGRLHALREQYGLTDMIAFLGSRDQESFGMVALEAMACGKPVVASQVGGLAYLIQDGVTGFTVPVDDPQELASRLMILINDEELRQRMGAQAASFASQYSWEKIALRIVDEYRAVLASIPDETLG